MATTLTIGGSSVNLSLLNAWPSSLVYRFRGYSTLTLARRGGAIPSPDPWLGKQAVLSIGGTVYFKGRVVDREPEVTAIGWVFRYLCRDLKAVADMVPLTDSNTTTATAAFNLDPDDTDAIASRMGRTVGQILTSVLTMVANATALNAAGIGGYTSLTPPTLPATTVSDLALLTAVPPGSVYVQGEKLWAGVESFVRYWAPNHVVWINPANGIIRFLDQRTFTNNTLTMGTDPIELTPLTRRVGDCFQRVVLRGNPIAERKVVSTRDGTLAEDFGFTDASGTVVSNATAKALWTPDLGKTDTQAKSQGTCTCTNTLNVVVNPDDNTQVWAANAFDQTSTGLHGSIDLFYTLGSGIDYIVSRRIVSNGALAAAGTCNVTVDRALPATNYDRFKIYANSYGLGLVYKKYKVVDPTIAAAMTRQLTYPSAWVFAGGAAEVLTSYPIGSTCYSSSGNPPYVETPAYFTMDPTTGNLYFQPSTYANTGNHAPSDVRALLAINTGQLTAVYPPDVAGSPVYAGTSYTVEALQDTLTVEVGEWRDPVNQAAMVSYAQDLHGSVSDAIIEGTVVYRGQYLTALTPGNAISIAGSGYTTGWESAALPIMEAELVWNLGGPTRWTTIMHLSNRRSAYTSAAFLRPSRQVAGDPISASFFFGGFSPFGSFDYSTSDMMGMAQGESDKLAADFFAGPQQGGYIPGGEDFGFQGPNPRAPLSQADQIARDKAGREAAAFDRMQDEMEKADRRRKQAQRDEGLKRLGADPDMPIRKLTE